MRRALEDYQVVGPQTNIEFLKRLTEHEAFIAAEVETGFITKHFNSLFGPTPVASPSNLAQAGIYLALRDIESVKEIASDPWSSPHLAGFRIGNVGSDKTFEITEPIEDGRNATVTVSAPIMGAYEVTVVDFEALESKFTKVRPSVVKGDGATSVSALLESKFSKVDIIPVQMERGETLHLFSGDFVGTLEVRLPKWKLALGSSNSGGSIGSAKATMRKLPTLF